MLLINKITSCETVDYAALELKKYLRMMMPTVNVKILYAPDATSGFRLGLMQDFGLDVSDAKSPELDDIVYIDTNKSGGIIAGDNPRSVLMAVYEFFRQNGCRWLLPGIDGEYIPMKEIEAVKYRHLASCRYRGACIEGTPSQQILLETIEFFPKVALNVFQMQFFVPTFFYERYYHHELSTEREPEPISYETMLQWKTACEAEMSKRGIQFHDVGHGWTAAPFGIDTSKCWNPIPESSVPEVNRQYLALVNGRRGLHDCNALNTQFCMSSKEARKTVAEYIANYAEQHQNVDYLQVWLADNQNNHCTCDNCVTKTVSDWYVILLNEIDEALKRKNLNTRVVFIVYTETTWAPLTERINNPERFALMVAPIARSYTHTLTNKKYETPSFVRNNIQLPIDLDGYIAHFKDWQKVWSGASFCFDYHFWKHQGYEPSGLLLAKRVYEDIEAYKENGIDGIVACGSQRSFFPTGFAYYVFARKQFDLSLSFDEILKDYFSTAFGEDWKNFVSYLYEIADCFGQKYLEGEEGDVGETSKYVSLERAKKLRRAKSVIDNSSELITSHYNSPYRIRTVSLKLLEYHAVYCNLLAKALAYKANREDDKAIDAFYEFKKEMCKREMEIERYFELFLCMRQCERIIKSNTQDVF